MLIQDNEILFFRVLNCPGETSPVKIREMEIFHIQGSNWDVISIRKKSLTIFFKSKSLLFSSLQKSKNYTSIYLFSK